MSSSKENAAAERGLFARFSNSLRGSPAQPSKQGAARTPQTSRLPAAPLSSSPAAAGQAAAAAAAERSGSLLRPRTAASTPCNFSRPPQSARGPAPPGTLAQLRRAADSVPQAGALTARRVPKASPDVWPQSAASSASYRDALVTPRSRLPQPPPSARHPPPPIAAAAPQQQQQQQQQGREAPGAPAPQQQQPVGEASAAQQQLAELQRQALLATTQQARASHEEEHTKQQISRFEAIIAAQQAELQGRLAAVAALGQRREALADHATKLGQLCAQAKAEEEGRQAQLRDLELSTNALLASLEGLKLQEAASQDKVAAARAALMGTMRSAAHTLKLPALAASLDDGCASPSSSCAPAAVPRAGAGAARPGSVQQAQQHAVPQPQCPGSPSEGYNTAGSREADSDGPSSDSSDSDQSSSCGSSPRQLGGGADRGSGSQAPRRQAPPLPPLRLPALDSADGGTAGSSSSRIPGMSLLSPQPVLGAAAAGSKSEPQGAGGGLAAALVAAAGQGPLSPEVVARLQTISSKLEAAIQSQEVELEASA